MLWYGPRLVRTRSGRGGARLAAACTGLALLATVPAAVGANGVAPRPAAESERRSAVLELYALESELQGARSAAAALVDRRTDVARRHASARQRLTIARRAAALSTRRLEELVRRLYEQRGVDPLEVLLGSRSLEEAMTDLESLETAALEQSRILERSRATRAELVRLDAQLAARERELATLTAAAEARAEELAARAAAKAAYVETLRRRQSLSRRQVGALEATASTAQQHSTRLQPPAAEPVQALVADPAAAVDPVLATDGTMTLSVSAIGYSLRGTDRHRAAGRTRHRRRRSERDPARHATVRARVRRRRRGRHRQRHPGRRHRPVVPDRRRGTRLGPPHGHDHRRLTLFLDWPSPSDNRETRMSETASVEAEEHEVRVLLVDDHDLFRTGLRNLLEEQGVAIVGEAASGYDALRIVRESTPDVVIMDLNMPGMNGVDATRHISREAPLTRVIVLTISDQEQDVMDAILAGACGYLLKDASIQDLMKGIEAAAVGESLISPHIAGKVLQHVRATTVAPDAAATIRAELSDREIQVLKLIASGNDNAMIARELHISPKTVKNHISNILMKLQIENRIQAAVYAVRSGIV